MVLEVAAGKSSEMASPCDCLPVSPRLYEVSALYCLGPSLTKVRLIRETPPYSTRLCFSFAPFFPAVPPSYSTDGIHRPEGTRFGSSSSSVAP